VLIEGRAERLKQIISEVCQEHQAEVLQVEVMPDHVHVLVECDPQFGLHPLLTSGISCIEAKTPYPVDKELLRLNGGRSATQRHEAGY